MNGPRDSTNPPFAAIYWTFVRLMDYGFLFMGLLGCVAGIVSVAIGFRADVNYPELLILCGGVALLVCLPTVVAWGFSYRLRLVLQMQTQIREDLHELARRTKA